MSEDFNWLEEARHDEPQTPVAESGRRRLFSRLPRISLRPRRPGLPALPPLPRLFRRQRDEAPSSASQLISEREERPLEELDERLRDLRQRSLQGSEPPADQPLYNVDEVLVSPEALNPGGGLIGAVALSKAQEEQVELLRDIVDGATPGPSPGGASPGRGSPVALTTATRLVAAVFVLLLASLPFVSSDFDFFPLPPADFEARRGDARSLYNALDNLRPDDRLLLALEYGATAAGELDPLADLALRHIFAQGAQPLIVSSNPIAIARAENIIREINRSVMRANLVVEAGAHYHILRYLPGGALGLRELSENFAAVARYSSSGAETGLDIASLADLQYIVLLAESAETIRFWAEQVVPESAETPLLAITSYAAEPLAQAYAESLPQIAGLLHGYRDAFSYGEMLKSAYGMAPPIPLTPTLEPAPNTTATPLPASSTPDPTATPAPITPTLDWTPTLIHITVQPTATATPDLQRLSTAPPGERATPSREDLDDPANQPGEQAVAVATVMAQPTSAPAATIAASDTPGPTATVASIRVVEVISPQQVRIRRGPTTADDILRLAQAGDRFEVVGANGDGSWHQIALEPGLNGWIAQFLVEELVMTEAEFRSGSASLPAERAVLLREYDWSLGKTGPRYYQAQPPSPADLHEFAQLRDRHQEGPRLQAMSLGALAAALVIVLGNLVHGVGALLRRRGASAR